MTADSVFGCFEVLRKVIECIESHSIHFVAYLNIEDTSY